MTSGHWCSTPVAKMRRSAGSLGNDAGSDTAVSAMAGLIAHGYDVGGEPLEPPGNGNRHQYALMMGEPGQLEL